MKRGDILGSADARTVVLFHRDADGFASAFAAWCALGDADVRYESVQYGEPVPTLPRGSRLYIVDFSYPAEILNELAEAGCQVTVLDHHKTAAAALQGFPPPGAGVPRPPGQGYVECLFDLSKSGCELAWEYFANPLMQSATSPAAELLAEQMPVVLWAIAMRDLWKHVDRSPTVEAQIENVCARMEIEPWDFHRWEDIVYTWRKIEGGFIAEGGAIMTYKRHLAAQQAEQWHTLGVRGHAPIVACAASVLQSETAHALLAAHPETDAVACYAMEKHGVRVSLRARTSGTEDVSELAKQYPGGGGHRNAAGFFFPCGPVKLGDWKGDLDENGDPWWQKGQRSPSEVDQVVTTYIDELAVPIGEDGEREYEPTGFERWLIDQAIEGLLCEGTFEAAWARHLKARAAGAADGADDAEGTDRIQDTFNGDDAHLVRSIEALLALDARGALIPHGIGGHARGLLSAAAVRMQVSLDERKQARGPAPEKALDTITELCRHVPPTTAKITKLTPLQEAHNKALFVVAELAGFCNRGFNEAMAAAGDTESAHVLPDAATEIETLRKLVAAKDAGGVMLAMRLEQIAKVARYNQVVASDWILKVVEQLEKAAPTGADLIVAERSRQKWVEGWDEVHDDMHTPGTLATAGEVYIAVAAIMLKTGAPVPACFRPKGWPFELSAFKLDPDPLRMLVKGAGLVAAEMDRCLRAGMGPKSGGPGAEIVMECSQDAREVNAVAAAESAPMDPRELMLAVRNIIAGAERKPKRMIIEARSDWAHVRLEDYPLEQVATAEIVIACSQSGRGVSVLKFRYGNTRVRYEQTLPEVVAELVDEMQVAPEVEAAAAAVAEVIAKHTTEDTDATENTDARKVICHHVSLTVGGDGRCFCNDCHVEMEAMPGEVAVWKPKLGGNPT